MAGGRRDGEGQKANPPASLLPGLPDAPGTAAASFDRGGSRPMNVAGETATPKSGSSAGNSEGPNSKWRSEITRRRIQPFRYRSGRSIGQRQCRLAQSIPRAYFVGPAMAELNAKLFKTMIGLGASDSVGSERLRRAPRVGREELVMSSRTQRTLVQQSASC